MEEKMAFPEKPKIFKPSRRRLFDFLLTLNTLLLVIAAFTRSTPFAIGVFFTVTNTAFISVWYFVLTPIMTITIANNTVSGRDGKMVMQSIPFRKIHFTNTIVSPEGMKRSFFKDIHSIDGRTIRIQRQFLGEGQVNKIIVTIERYPFREGTT